MRLLRLLPLILVLVLGAVFFSRMGPVILEPSAVITGSVIDAAPRQQDIRAGGETVVLTLAEATWAADVAAPTSAAYNALVRGIAGDSTGNTVWNNGVQTALLWGDGSVVRDSDTQVTVTLPSVPGYRIGTSETVTMVVPLEALGTGDGPIAAIPSPAFAVAPVSLSAKP